MSMGLYGILIVFALFVLLLILNPSLSCFGKRIRSPFYPLLRGKRKSKKQVKTEDYGFRLSDQPKKKLSEYLTETATRLDSLESENKSLKTTLELMRTKLDEPASIPQVPPGTTEDRHTDSGADATRHHTPENIMDCPDCMPKAIQSYMAQVKDSKVTCKGCQLPVKKEWESCPNCGSTDASED